jgi:hypothetical protein
MQDFENKGRLSIFLLVRVLKNADHAENLMPP